MNAFSTTNMSGAKSARSRVTTAMARRSVPVRRLALGDHLDPVMNELGAVQKGDPHFAGARVNGQYARWFVGRHRESMARDWRRLSRSWKYVRAKAAASKMLVR